MNSYNNIIIPKIVNYVEYITKRLLERDNSKRKAELISHEQVLTDDYSSDYLIANNETEAFKILFKFRITSEDGESSEEMSSELLIPKVKNNIFIIKGKIRIPSSTLDNSYSVRVYKDKDNKDLYNIVINNYLKINYSLITKRFYFYVYDKNTGEELRFEDNDENYEKFKDYLKLSQEEKYKIQIKLDIPAFGDYLTHDILVRLARLGPDKHNDNIIDKQIYSVEDNLINTLRDKSTVKEILKNIRRKFYSNGIIYLKDIQNAIDSYFYVANEENISIPSKVNPLLFDSLNYKIRFPDHIAYNETFTDIIDVVNTPENQNVNKINELNVCCSIEEGKIYIHCYKFKTGEKIKIPYLEYLNSNVLLNSYYDYDINSEIDSNEYHYKLRQKEYKVNSLDNIKIDYVEPKPDEKLSISTRRIPMINNSDSVRVAMGISMLKQAIEIDDNEPRLIYSGNDDTDYFKSTMLIKNTEKNPIVIESIEGNKINYRDKVTGSTAFFTIEDPIKGINDAPITFSPAVKVGDELKYGDVVINPSIMKRKSYDLGTNAFVFYMNYLGDTFEDGIVISESFAKKTTHYNIHDLSIELRSNDKITYLRKIGEKLSLKDILVSSETPAEDTSLTDFQRRIKLIDKEEKKYRKLKLTVPSNFDEGYVVDVQITQNPDNPIKDEKTLNVINEFFKNPKIKEDIDLPDKYKNLKIKPIEIKPNFSCVINYKIVRVNKTKVGDKMTNSWGSKGEVALVLPDDQMPYRNEDGKIAEVLLNPLAVLARKNPSQLYEAALSKVIKFLYEIISYRIKEGDDIEEIKNSLPIWLYGNKYKKMTNNEFLENHRKGIFGYAIKTGSYNKINLDDLLEYMKEYNLSEADEVTSPKLGPIENPIVTGYSYIIKLFHSGDYSGKVTSAVFDSRTPYMGRGLYRDEGQKIGEMELHALLAYGMENFIQDQNSNSDISNYIFLNELLLAGYTIMDENKLPLLSNYRRKFSQ